MGYEFSEPILSKASVAFLTIKDFGVSDISLASMEKVLEQVSPNLALTGTSAQEGKANDIVEHTTTRAARKLDIASLAVLDIWQAYSQRFSDERTSQRLDILPTHIAVMDQLAYDEMVAEGFPKEVLVITGNPHFDNLFAKAQSFTELQRKEIRQKIGLSGDILHFFGITIFS